MRKALASLFALACIGVCALALRAEPAQACGACICPAESAGPMVWAGDMTGAVPTDAHLFISGAGDDVTIETSDGELVASRVEASDAPGAFFLIPDAPLSPNTTYVLRSVETGEVVDSVVTGAGPSDGVAPVLFPPEPAEANEVGGYCNATVGLPLDVPNGMNGGLLRIEVEDDTHSATVFVSAAAGRFALLRPSASDGVTEDCAGPLAIDFLVAGQAYDLRTSRLGAVGGFSEPVTLSVTAVDIDNAGCPDMSGTTSDGGCAVTSATPIRSAPSAVLALVALGALGALTGARRRSR